MGITGLLDAPLFTGGASSTLIGKYPVALNGRPYMVDTNPPTFYDRWKHESFPLMRQQADPSTIPAESSINPEGLWRRAQDSWHHGAGQVYRDRDNNGDPYRYRTSKGIDPWTKYQVTLLPATGQKHTSSNTNLALVSAGSRLYYADGSTLRYTTDITGVSPTWSTTTYAGGSILSLTSDGYTVYFTDGSNIYTTNTGSTTSTSADTTDAGIVAYVKGRLMVAGTGSTKNVLYNIPTLGSAASLTFTHGNADFTWVGFAEGTGAIYAAGYSGDKSLIYRISIKSDASSLDPPIVAGELPDGEIIRSISGYLGFIVLGTDTGWRFCDIDGQGNLTIGPRVTTTSAVRCFEPQDRFVWYGQTNYDSTSTGLGRMDITQFTQALTPAYATDLMTTAQGNVLSVATFNSLRVYAVSGSGVWAETTDKVASGTLLTGDINYNIPDPKTAMIVDMQTSPLVGSYTVALATDDGTVTTLDTESAVGNISHQFSCNQATGERFELTFTLTRSSTATTTGPTLLRYTLKALPTANEGLTELISVPFLLHRTIEVDNEELFCDVNLELAALKGLHETRQIVTYQELGTTSVVVVENYRWMPVGLRIYPDGWAADGTFLAELKRIL